MNVSLLLLGAIALCILSGCHGIPDSPGSPVCSRKAGLFEGMRFKGKLVSTNLATSLKSCQQKCATNTACQFYSYGLLKCDLMTSDTGRPVEAQQKALTTSGYSTRDCSPAA